MNTINKPNDNGGKEKMVQRSISIELSLWNDARRKAGIRPLSAIIRKLIKLWMSGKIKLDDYKD